VADGDADGGELPQEPGLLRSLLLNKTSKTALGQSPARKRGPRREAVNFGPPNSAKKAAQLRLKRSCSRKMASTPTEETLDELLRDAPRNTAARAAQEASWDLEGKEDARRLLYEREVAARHATLLAASINAYWRAEALAAGHAQDALPLPKETVALIAEFAEPSADKVAVEAIRRRESASTKQREGVKVYARLRPAADESLRVLDCTSHNAVVLHEAKLSRSHRVFGTRHHRLELDGVFERDADEVARGVVDPLVGDVLRGRPATLFGQTGTGKTHTLREALNRFVARVDGPCSVRFVELAGRKACRDLLNNANAVKLLSDAADRVHFKWAPPRICGGRAALRATLDEGLALRASVQMERNAASSRSHAVVEIEINGATMTFVDLAGSERKWETMKLRGREHQRESADINLSLMALKDCFRARYENRRIPYRASPLTRVLRRCFDVCSVAIMATLSAAPDDLIHSLYSLETVCLMAPDLTAFKTIVETQRLFAATGSCVGGDPMEWGAAVFHRWLLTAENSRFAHVVVPEGTTGKELLGMGGAALGALFAGAGQEGRVAQEGSAWTVEALGGGGLAK